MKKASAKIDFEVWNLDCPNCGADHKFDRKEVESEFLYCSECGEAFEPVMSGLEAELLEALKELKKQIFAHHKMNVKKDFSLLLADAVASKAIAKAEGKN